MRRYILESPSAKAVNAIYGATPEEAVREYFDEVDLWCPPPSFEAEHTAHRIFDVTDLFDDEQFDELRDLDSIDLEARLREIRSRHSGIEMLDVCVSHLGDGGKQVLRVSQPIQEGGSC
ncbi:hypothetical protein [Jiella sp. M17.18]|uniref:hypothetical protein n=1 Tax=Jiella sp. M17.18 TaxID=3234247 RepID=UPI0034DF9335